MIAVAEDFLFVFEFYFRPCYFVVYFIIKIYLISMVLTSLK